MGLQIQRQMPLTQQEAAWGYNRDQYMKKVNALTYWNYGGTSYPYNSPMPEQSPLIHTALWNRSVSVIGALSGNAFVWGDIPELSNVPVAGLPGQTSPQYVLVPSLRVPTTTRTNKKPLSQRIHRINIPLAYGKQVRTGASPNAVYQVPDDQISSIRQQAATGSRFMQWLTGLIGDQNNE